MLGDEDFWPLEKLGAVQESNWELQRQYVNRHSPFYQRLWAGTEPPERLAELHALPLTTKEMLRQAQVKAPIFGDYLAAPLDKVIRLHRSSGTTGRAVNMALSAKDAAQNAEIGGRAHRACSLGPGFIVVHCLNYQLWMGGYTDHETLEAAGVMTVPFGAGASELLIRTILDLGITAIQCTPSYPAVLERVIAEKFPDLKPRDLGLKIGILTGEPGLENPAFRERVEATWGFEGRNAYGMSETLSNFAGQCDCDENLHFVGPDVLYPELIDAESGAAIPWHQGSTGELVLTHLARECQPLVRFRTRDIIEITDTGPCPCGRTVPRFRVLGRTDDMVIVRGVNVFPAAVSVVLNRFTQLSGEFRIVLKGSGPYQRLPVEAERAEGHDPSPNLAEVVEAALKDQLGATAEVVLLPPLSLPRTDGKTQRVYRED
jgi:phenylacetate-CoA ligase